MLFVTTVERSPKEKAIACRYSVGIVNNHRATAWYSMYKKIVLAIGISLAICSQSVIASESESSPFSMGLQMAPLTFGLSVRYASSENWKWQAVVSPAEAEDISYTLRALRTTRSTDYWSSYLFAGVANGRTSFSAYEEQSTIFSGGLGVEWSWRARNNNLPPLLGSIEFGLGYENTTDDREDDNNNDYYYESDGLILVLGLGLHFQF